jgi:hypothetical protein
MFPKSALQSLRWLVFLAACHAAGLMLATLTLAAEGSATAEPVLSAGPTASESENAAACRELKALVEQQKSQLGREIGQLKREMALLREDLGKPGVKEIFAGIGYILGLAGIGLYAHCRKSSKNGRDV